jgi:hypothetical protein
MPPVRLVVGVYVGLGFPIHPDPNTYLLLGIPITFLFQLVIARRPVRNCGCGMGTRPVRPPHGGLPRQKTSAARAICRASARRRPSSMATRRTQYRPRMSVQKLCLRATH